MRAHKHAQKYAHILACALRSVHAHRHKCTHTCTHAHACTHAHWSCCLFWLGQPPGSMRSKTCSHAHEHPCTHAQMRAQARASCTLNCLFWLGTSLHEAYARNNMYARINMEVCAQQSRTNHMQPCICTHTHMRGRKHALRMAAKLN